MRLRQFEAESFGISADHHMDVDVDPEAGQSERQRAPFVAPVRVLKLHAVPGNLRTPLPILLAPIVLSSS